MRHLNNRELTRDEMVRHAPAIFADMPFNDVSKRYEFMPTYQVMGALQDHGWHPVEVQQVKARSREAMAFVPHCGS